MTWFTDAQIATDAVVDGPIKAQTLNRVQQNITSAFSGESGAPPLGAGVVGSAYAGLPLDGLGTHRQVYETSGADDVSYTPGTTYSAASLGLSAGTWMHLGGGLSGFQAAVGSPPADVYYFLNLFVRVA